MKTKRDMGVCGIFLASCGIAALGAGVVWLASSLVCAFFMENALSYGTVYSSSVSDVVTPWLMLAAGMITYYRFSKICSANSVSPKKQTVCLAEMSAIFSAVFACADLAFVKGILQRIYGGAVCVFHENKIALFRDFLYNRYKAAETAEAFDTAYPVGLALLLLAYIILYYYSFFLSGCIVAGCIKSGRKKLSAYFLVTALFGMLLYLTIDKWDSSPVRNIFGLFTVICYAVGGFTNPIMFSYQSVGLLADNPVAYMGMSAVFIILIAGCICDVTGDIGVNDDKLCRTMPALENVISRIKRFFGSLRLTALSAERSAAAAIILWIMINFGYAVCLGWNIHGNRYFYFYPDGGYGNYFIKYFRLYSDAASPFILIAAAAFMVSKHTKLCAANSVSGRLQALCGLLAGGVFSLSLAAADIIFTKTIISELAGKTKYTFIEKYLYSIDVYKFNLSDVIEPGSSGIMQLFSVTVLYYLAVFMTAYLYMQCICGRSKLIRLEIAAAIIEAALTAVLFISYDYDAVFSAAILLISVCFLFTPHIMLVIIIAQAGFMDSEMSCIFMPVICIIHILAMLVLSMEAKPEISEKANRIKRN